MDANIARMQLLAKDVLSHYEKTDISKHWKTRRHGYWGYLSDLGGRVADRVFPVMEQSLNNQLKPFSEFIDLASKALDGLQSQIESLESDSMVEGLPRIEFGATKKRFMDEYVNELKERVGNEKDAIIQVLEEFATGELKKNLLVPKTMWQKSGVSEQPKDNLLLVSNFYDDIGKSLTAALEAFLKKRLNTFGVSLSKNADSLFPKAQDRNRIALGYP